jgi:hypothetical protein
LTGRDDPPAKTELAKLREEIRRCEAFLALCDRIKELERLDETNALCLSLAKLETQRAQFLVGLQQSKQAVERDEDLLRSGGHAAGALQALKDRIHSGRVRSSSLELNAEEVLKQIELTQAQLQNNPTLLRELYEELEHHMQQGFHPNTVTERLASLRELKTQLNAAVRANFPLKAEEQKISPRSEEKRRPPNEVPVTQTEFFTFLAEDLIAAKKSVEILSPFIALERSRQILPMLARLVADGCNVMVRTRPSQEHDEEMKEEAMQVIADSHRLRITVIQQSGLRNNVAIIDGHTCWEGDVNILGPSEEGKTMRRIVGSSKVRELRRFLSES